MLCERHNDEVDNWSGRIRKKEGSLRDASRMTGDTH